MRLVCTTRVPLNVTSAATSGTTAGPSKHRTWSRSNQQREQRALANKLRNCSNEEQLVQHLTAAPTPLLDSINAARAVVSYANIKLAQLTHTGPASPARSRAQRQQGQPAAANVHPVSAPGSDDQDAWPYIHSLLLQHADLLPLKEAADTAWALGKLRQLGVAAAPRRFSRPVQQAGKQQAGKQQAQQRQQKQKQHDEQLTGLLQSVLDRVNAILTGPSQQESAQQQALLQEEAQQQHPQQHVQTGPYNKPQEARHQQQGQEQGQQQGQKQQEFGWRDGDQQSQQMCTDQATTMQTQVLIMADISLADAAKVLWAATQLPVGVQCQQCCSLVPKLLQACTPLLAACCSQQQSVAPHNKDHDYTVLTRNPDTGSSTVKTGTAADSTSSSQPPPAAAGKQHMHSAHYGTTAPNADAVIAKNLAIIGYSVAELDNNSKVFKTSTTDADNSYQSFWQTLHDSRDGGGVWGGDGNDSASASAQDWLNLWMHAFLTVGDHATPQGLAMAVWAAARLQYMPTTASMASLQAFAIQHLPKMAPQGAAMTVWGLATLQANDIAAQSGAGAAVLASGALTKAAPVQPADTAALKMRQPSSASEQGDDTAAVSVPSAALPNSAPVAVRAPSAASLQSAAAIVPPSAATMATAAAPRPARNTESRAPRVAEMQSGVQQGKVVLNKQQLDVLARQLQLHAPAMTQQDALQALHGLALLARASPSQAFPYIAHNLLQQIPLQPDQQQGASSKTNESGDNGRVRRSQGNRTASDTPTRQAAHVALTASELSNVLWDVVVLGYSPSAAWLRDYWVAVKAQLQQQADSYITSQDSKGGGSSMSVAGAAMFTVRDAAQLLWAATALKCPKDVHGLLIDIVPSLLDRCVQDLPGQARTRGVAQIAADLSYCAWGVKVALDEGARQCLPLWFVDLSVEAVCAAASTSSGRAEAVSVATPRTSVLEPAVVCRLLSVLAWLQYLPPDFDQLVDIVMSPGFADDCTQKQQRGMAIALAALHVALPQRHKHAGFKSRRARRQLNR